MKEMRVGIRDLKSRLSHYLHQTKAGTVIVVTERGRPIARIVPEGGSLDTRLHELAAKGFLKWSGTRLRPGSPVIKNRGPKLFSDIILEDRR